VLAKVIVPVAEQVPYREPGTPSRERMSPRAGVLLGLIILGAGAVLLGVGLLLKSELKIYPLVIGFGGACLGLSIVLNGMIDWMRGK
jgi:hypothetical protein